MNEFTLLPGETVIRRCDEVSASRSTLLSAKTDILILTNQNIVYIKRNLFHKVKSVDRYPLSDIVMTDGIPQVQVGKPDNVTHTLDIYFKTGEMRIQMTWEKEIKQWVNSIVEVTTGRKAETKGGFGLDSDDFDFADDLLKVADNVNEAMGKFRKAFGIKSNVQLSGKCSGCGASLTGREGETVQCPYCGTYHSF